MFFPPASQPGDQLLIPTHVVYPRRIPTKLFSITAGQSHGPTLERSSFDRAPFPGESSLIDIHRKTQSGSRHSHSSHHYHSLSGAYIGADERHDEEVWAVIHSQAAQYRLERITRGETGSESVRGCLDKRAANLADIQQETVRQAVHPILNASPHVPCLGAMAHLARTLRIRPSTMSTMVDDQGNPYTEHILAFIDTILVLYRSVATCPSADDHDETDDQAFGAITATTFASQILILIPHAHHHVIRALWFALLYLSIAYTGLKRATAVNYLIGRITANWRTRREDTWARRTAAWSSDPVEQEVEEEWMRRAGRISDFRRRGKGQLRVGDIWAVMKGMGSLSPLDHDSLTTPQLSGVAESKTDVIPPVPPRHAPILAVSPRSGDETSIDTPLSSAVFERAGGSVRGISSRVSLSPDKEGGD